MTASPTANRTEATLTAALAMRAIGMILGRAAKDTADAWPGRAEGCWREVVLAGEGARAAQIEKALPDVPKLLAVNSPSKLTALQGVMAWSEALAFGVTFEGFSPQLFEEMRDDQKALSKGFTSDADCRHAPGFPKAASLPHALPLIAMPGGTQAGSSGDVGYHNLRDKLLAGLKALPTDASGPDVADALWRLFADAAASVPAPVRTFGGHTRVVSLTQRTRIARAIAIALARALQLESQPPTGEKDSTVEWLKDPENYWVLLEVRLAPTAGSFADPFAYLPAPEASPERLARAWQDLSDAFDPWLAELLGNDRDAGCFVMARPGPFRAWLLMDPVKSAPELVQRLPKLREKVLNFTGGRAGLEVGGFSVSARDMGPQGSGWRALAQRLSRDTTHGKLDGERLRPQTWAGLTAPMTATEASSDTSTPAESAPVIRQQMPAAPTLVQDPTPPRGESTSLGVVLGSHAWIGPTGSDDIAAAEMFATAGRIANFWRQHSQSLVVDQDLGAALPRPTGDGLVILARPYWLPEYLRRIATAHWQHWGGRPPSPLKAAALGTSAETTRSAELSLALHAADLAGRTPRPNDGPTGDAVALFPKALAQDILFLEDLDGWLRMADDLLALVGKVRRGGALEADPNAHRIVLSLTWRCRQAAHDPGMAWRSRLTYLLQRDKGRRSPFIHRRGKKPMQFEVDAFADSLDRWRADAAVAGTLDDPARHRLILAARWAEALLF